MSEQDLLNKIDTCHQKIIQEVTLNLTVPEDINKVLLPFLSECSDDICDVIDGLETEVSYEPVIKLCTDLINVFNSIPDADVRDELKTTCKDRVKLIFETYPFGSNGAQTENLSNESLDAVSAGNNTP